MNLSKTQWIIVIAVVAIAVYYFFFRDKESGYTKQDIRSCWAPKADGSGYYKVHDGPCTRTEANANWSTHWNA